MDAASSLQVATSTVSTLSALYQCQVPHWLATINLSLDEQIEVQLTCSARE